VITSIGLDELQELLGEGFRSASLHRFAECSDNSFASTTIICLVILLSFMKWKFHIICNDKVIEQLVVDIALTVKNIDSRGFSLLNSPPFVFDLLKSEFLTREYQQRAIHGWIVWVLLFIFFQHVTLTLP
jgi:hypothetical protein